MRLPGDGVFIVNHQPENCRPLEGPLGVTMVTVNAAKSNRRTTAPTGTGITASETIANNVIVTVKLTYATEPAILLMEVTFSKGHF